MISSVDSSDLPLWISYILHYISSGISFCGDLLSRVVTFDLPYSSIQHSAVIEGLPVSIVSRGKNLH